MSSQVTINSLSELYTILDLILPGITILSQARIVTPVLQTTLCQALSHLRAIFDFARCYILITSSAHQRALSYLRSERGPVMRIAGTARNTKCGSLAWAIKVCEVGMLGKDVSWFLRSAVAILKELKDLETLADMVCEEEFRASHKVDSD